MGEKEKDINLHINPKKGLYLNDKKLLFGISMENTEKILGKANKTYTTDDNNIRWQYYNYFLELSFEKDNNYILGWIEMYHINVKIFDTELIGEKKNKVIEYFNLKLNEVPQYEDYHSFETIFYENNWIELQFQFGRLHNINFGT